jgi:non-canonical (house-cleaning) NTP pyrophosphatase
VSSIRVQHGSAEVELTAEEVYSGEGTRAFYWGDDLVYATLRALRAVESPRAAALVAALEAGLESKGFSL